MDTDQRIKELIAALVLRDSYWGYLFSKCKKKSLPIPSILGVCVADDGFLELIYNPQLIDGTDDKVIILGLQHEGTHILNKHLLRLNELFLEFPKDQHETVAKLWNIASDICCNYLCKMPDSIVINGLQVFPHLAKMYELPDNMSAEYYFHKLLKIQKENKGKGEEGDNQKSSNGENVGDHSQWKMKQGTFSPKKIEKIFQDEIFNALKNVRDRGKLPGDLKSLIDQALEKPKVPYYQIIRKLVRGSIFAKEKNAYSKVNKKRSYAFYYKPMLFLPFPGKEKDRTFKIIILLDTSGSMSKEQLKEGLSGVKNIIENDRNCKTTVIEIDTKIQNEYEVKRIADINYEPKGRGGTTLFPGLERARELNADVVLVFTDAACDNINAIDRKLLPKKIIYVVPLKNNISAIDRTGFVVRADY